MAWTEIRTVLDSAPAGTESVGNLEGWLRLVRAYLVMGAVSVGVWQEWWVAAAFLAAAACASLWTKAAPRG